MKRYIPINKKTGVEYPIITEEAKLAYEATPSTNVFRFIEVVPAPRAAAPLVIKPAPQKQKSTRKKTAATQGKPTSKDGQD